MPDFGYWSWPLDVVGEYTQVRTEIRALEEELKFEDKKPLVVWRGSTRTNILREYLVNGTVGKSWSDIQAIEWRNMTTMMPGDEELSISMPDHCAYQFVLHTEGKLAFLFWLATSLLTAIPATRPLILGQRQVPAELRVSLHHAQDRVDRAAHAPAGSGGRTAKHGAGGARLLRPGGQGAEATGAAGSSAGHRRGRRTRLPRPLPHACRPGLLLAPLVRRVEECHGL